MRRICIHGGPGSGKSWCAARVFSELKRLHYDVELVTEYVKMWAYEGRVPTSYDQLTLLAEQLRREDLVLRHVDYLVTECPLMMCCAYAKKYNFKVYPQLIEIANHFDNDFPSLNFLITRTVPYVTKGRYQDQASAEEFDQFLLEFLEEYTTINVRRITVDDFDLVIETIRKEIDDRNC